MDANQLVHEPSPFGDSYIGSRAQMITAGLLADGMFPGDAGRNKSRQTYSDMPGAGQSLAVTRTSRHRFHIYVRATAEEVERRQARERLDRDTREAAEHLRKNLACLPTSAEDYRARMVRFFGGTISAELRCLDALGFGYRFHPEAVEQFREAVDEALCVLRTARVIYRGQERQRAVQDMREQYTKVIAADTAFMSFMAAASATADVEPRAAD
jgi:hypothetical protein